MCVCVCGAFCRLISRGNRSTPTKLIPVPLVHHKSHIPYVGSNLNRIGGKPTTNGLGYDMVCNLFLVPSMAIGVFRPAAV
jgi:hypothetical protein